MFLLFQIKIEDIRDAFPHLALETASTESLSGYLTQLAQEHCLTHQKLIMGEIAPIF